MKIKKYCDELFSRIVRLKNKCEICGKKKNLTSYRIINKIKYKYDINNALCVCTSCNFLSKNSIQKSPKIMLDQWLEKNKPEQYNHIKQMRKDNEKVTILYEQMYDQLENLYRYYTNSYYSRERIKDLVLKNNLKFMKEYYELISNIDIVSKNIGQELGIRESIVKKFLKENL